MSFRLRRKIVEWCIFGTTPGTWARGMVDAIPLEDDADAPTDEEFLSSMMEEEEFADF